MGSFFLTNPLGMFIGIISKQITTILPYKFTGITFRDTSHIRNARRLEPKARTLRRLHNYIALILTLHDHDFRTPFNSWCRAIITGCRFQHKTKCLRYDRIAKSPIKSCTLKTDQFLCRKGKHRGKRRPLKSTDWKVY